MVEHRDLLYLFCLLFLTISLSCTSDADLFTAIEENQGLDTTETTEEESSGIENTESADNQEPEEEDNGEVGSAIFGENIFYVTTEGSSSNDGKTEDTAWNIDYAFNNAQAGNIVYVKAGNYHGISLEVGNSGTAANPIQFIGYKTTPEDIESSNTPTVTYEDYKNNGDSYNTNEMPTLIGERINDVGLGQGIHIIGTDYIEIKNFQISRYQHNILVQYSDYVKLDNMILSDSGDFNPDNTDANGGVNGRNNTGESIAAYFSNYISITNCLAINDGMRGIMVSDSNDGEHYNSRVYSDNNINSCDYYYLLYNSDNHVVDNIYIERVGDLRHEGHGLCLKDGSSNNLIKNSYIKATMLELSFDNVHDNIIQDCYIEGGFNEGEIRVANGAHDNKFYRNTVVGGEGGVTFCDWVDGGSDAISNAGFNNEFVDCTFSDMDFGIGFYFFAQFESVVYDNTFVNCNFKNLEYLFQVDRPNRGNKLQDCTIENVPSLIGFYYPQNNYRTAEVILESNTYINTGF